ncbi:FecCD family ABC transporter permease [Minwuia sp.]|uniref:FecCD family ABC transporter permease n=1 Tax=Minwuia sp. TaxID=2493630 RepID=UPI003A8EEFDB
MGIADDSIDLRAAEDRRLHRRKIQLVALWLVLVFGCLLSVCIGAVAISPAQVAAILLEEVTGLETGIPYGRREETVLMAIRLPRLALGLIVGSALGVAGAVLQGLFRNPLADPALIGVSSGAAVGAVLMIVLGAPLILLLPAGLGVYLIPVAAFAGGLVVTALVYALAQRQGGTDVAILLLAGVAMNAITAAVVGVMIFISTDQELRDLNFWLLGSLAGATWDRVGIILPGVVVALVGLMTLARFLNAILLGEEAAEHLGLRVETAKRLSILFVALATGGAVAMSGVIAFVGLMVPHMVRMAFGPDHRIVLPASALAGAFVIVAADLLARTVAVPADLPIGVVMSLTGGPFFVWLLCRKRGLSGWT